MEKTPKSMRIQIGLFGRTNVGKSTFLNLIAGQDVAITSPVPGTTTDVVEKVMEWLPLGPVVFLDTAGLDDGTELGAQRRARTERVFDRADVAILIAEPNVWTDHEERILSEARRRACPFRTRGIQTRGSWFRVSMRSMNGTSRASLSTSQKES